MDMYFNGCRCCLRNKYEGMKNIQEYYLKDLRFIDLIEYITDKRQMTHMANYLCDICELELVEAFHFKKKCLKSIDTLKEIKVEKSEIFETDDYKIIFDNVVEESDIAIDGSSIEVMSSENGNDNLLIPVKNKCITKNENDELSDSELVDYSSVESEELSQNSNFFKCKICNELFISAWKYEQHINACHQNDSQVSSSKSSKSMDFSEKYNYSNKSHIVIKPNMHNRRSTYKCKQCDLVFKSHDVLIEHNRNIHNSDEKFSCNKCNKVFENSTDYRTHIRTNHEEKFVCPECGKTMTRNGYHVHRQTHFNEKKYKCEDCGKEFQMKNSLANHMRVHKNDLRYKCNICGQKFLHWSVRRDHIVSQHTGEKKHECPMCHKRFIQRGNMVLHIRGHTGERPYQCDQCSMKFVSRGGLRLHTITHSLEKNQKCDICGKSFKTPKTLKVHLKIHNNERDYVCWICSRAFSQAHVLRTHLKTHPGTEIPPPGTILSIKKQEKLAKKYKNNSEDEDDYMGEEVDKESSE